MELEALVAEPIRGSGLFALSGGVLDFSALLARLADGMERREGAALFHGTLIDGFAALTAAHARPGEAVALGGGCLMNRILAEGLIEALGDLGLRPLVARAVPANDGGLSLGQAALARAHLAGSAGASNT